MAAWVCVGCTTVYAVGAPRCPHCQSAEHVEQGEPMPKITRHGGPTNAGAAESTPAEAAPAPDEEEVPSSPGTSSSPSSEKPPTSTEPSETAAPKRARTTGSRSKKGQTGSSTARSTDGEKTDTSDN